MYGSRCPEKKREKRGKVTFWPLSKNSVTMVVFVGGMGIHSKSGISWMEKSADDLEFSADGLSGNAKTFKFALL